jgi:hypothetical protein
MKYITQRIKTTLSGSATLATAAGVASMASRVFIRMGETDMIGNINLGRLPCIYLQEVGVDYEFIAEPDHAGTRSSEIKVIILIPTFINRSETQYLLGEKIKTTILSILTKDLALGVTDVREDAPVINQMSTQLTINITLDTSYDSNYSEGT